MIGAAGALALVLATGAGSALAAPAQSPPRPVPGGAELSVRPGSGSS